MSTDRLKALLIFKRQVEDRAATSLSQASAARVRADREQAALAEALVQARAALTAQRSKTPEGAERAADGADRHRFAARLASRVEACAQRLGDHRKTVLEPAQRAEDEARNRHLAARQDREAMEKHAERERAAALKQAEGKREAEQDDRGSGRGAK